MSDRVTWAIHEGVADVRLNRPEKMNAIDAAMFSALAEVGEGLKGDPSVRAVVLSGEGTSFARLSHGVGLLAPCVAFWARL